MNAEADKVVGRFSQKRAGDGLAETAICARDEDDA
jgi:hypothetical protein